LGLGSEESRIGMSYQPTQVACAEWGKIRGNLDDQTDLKERLDEILILAYAGL
jgi:hypothetical protein